MKHNNNPNIALLPSGFVDLMPEEAEKEAWAISELMHIFSGYGYQRIKPPLLEFEDSLLAEGPGSALSEDTFRLMDPVSHRMLGLRSDITPQIGRIVCTRLPQGDEPIRLTYANDVLRTRSGQMRSSRQFTQVGCEIIRDDSVDGYVEALMLIILGLKAIGVEDVTIDLSIPRALDSVLNHLNVSSDQDIALRDMVSKRDSDGIKALGNDDFDLIIDLMSASGQMEKALQKAKSLNVPGEVKGNLEKLEEIYSVLQQNIDDLYLENINITFDIFETKGFDYQSGIAFTVFSSAITGELGRGGYYDIHFDSSEKVESEKAIGFTLYMDTIRSGVNKGGDIKVVAVEQSVAWPEIEQLRKQEFIVQRVEDARKLPSQCNYIYQNGKAEKIKG